MIGLKRYNEVCTRQQKIAGRELSTGDIVRTVSISEREAVIMNSTEQEHGFKYVLAEEVKEEKIKEPTVVEKTDKEYRATLFAKATELGLNPPKNIKTENLEKQITEAEGK